MTHMLLCRMFFERFNVAGFTYIERPLASLYAANAITGVVIEIGQDETDLITCFESQLNHGSSFSVPIGIRDCERYLAHLLRSNTSVIGALSPPDRPVQGVELDKRLLSFARFLWQSGHIKIPMEGEPEKEDDGNLDIAALLVSGKERTVIEAANTKKKTAQNKADKEREKEMAAMDLVSVQFGDFGSIVVGKERHRFCEPLFEPMLLNSVSIPIQTLIDMDGQSQPIPPPKDLDFLLPLPTAVHTIVKAMPLSQRSSAYFGLLITGQLANIQGLGVALQSRLSTFLCADRIQSETRTPSTQPDHAQAIKVPEYFAEFRDKGDYYSAFLGCGIVAKMTFGESSGRNFVSKAEYGEKGPLSVLELTPTIL
ncbi:related to macronuclear actin 1 [Serendipita indica DSM 11827]|uniref:Related to macronuclear actin 1 n=1 Tax=Serendipita indica (strain DSM 11827) TaxID=1109443 RepID=G4TBP1_SERID|nr:related to macronuclear actin 1 [Serendipita indica DSM 11827]